MVKPGVNFLAIVIFLLTIVAINITDLFTYQQMRELSHAREWVMHTHEVIEMSDTIFQHILLAESAGKSFLLTNDKNYLQNFNNDKKVSFDGLNALKNLTVDNITQQNNVAEFELILKDRFMLLDDIIKSKEKNALDINILTDEVNKSFLLNKKLNIIHERINYEEKKLLKMRNDAVSQHYSNLEFDNLLSDIISTFLLIIIFITLIYQLRLRTLAYKQIEIVNKEIEEFAYAASHDLKAPLRVIDNASKWLEEDLEAHFTEESRENMNLLRGRVKRMEKLLDDLLEYSRIGRKKDTRFAEIITGDVLMTNILELLSPPKNFVVTVSPYFSKIHVNRMPLQQVLMNLISNAIKHHDEKKGHIEIIVNENDKYYTFAVKDDGPGIPAQFHQKIFDMFQTLKPRDQVEGSGMGLAMVRKNIDIIGGELHLESSEGNGSTFSFTWPKK